MSKVIVIIPALDEVEGIGKVLKEIPEGLVDEVVVVDNGSTDGTADAARGLGATVICEPRRGYGYACLAGIRHVSSLPSSDDMVVVFLDGDHSDHPEEMPLLVRPVLEEGYDMVVGSRLACGPAEDAMPAHSRLATVVVCKKLSILLHSHITDLGPFRAFRFRALRSLDMSEPTYGWTVEMTIKAYRKGLKVKEVPVSYRRRVGKAKISGTAWSSMKALMSMTRCMVKYTIQQTP